MKLCQLFRHLLTTLLVVLSTFCAAQVTLTINGQPVTSGSVAVTTGLAPPSCIPPQVLQGGVCVTPPPVCTPPAVWNGSACVNPTPPPAGCIIVNAPTQVGGIPPITPTQMGANQQMAFRASAETLNNRSVGAFQPNWGMTVAVSNQPCDFGPAGLRTQTGCYATVAGQNNIQIQIRVGAVNGPFQCIKPAPNANGDLFVNFKWDVYGSYSTGVPIRNYCTEQGNTVCAFQYRTDP
jgi:hypothetical protein